MGLALITVIGQCVGAGDYDQVRYYLKKTDENNLCYYVGAEYCLICGITVDFKGV